MTPVVITAQWREHQLLAHVVNHANIIYLYYKFSQLCIHYVNAEKNNQSIS